MLGVFAMRKHENLGSVRKIIGPMIKDFCVKKTNKQTSKQKKKKKHGTNV